MRPSHMYAAGQPSLPEDDSLSDEDDLGSSSSISKPVDRTSSKRIPLSPLSPSLYRSSPMARTSSQKRISQELNLGGSITLAGLRTPTSIYPASSSSPPIDDYQFPPSTAAKSTPTRQMPTRRHSSRTPSIIQSSSAFNGSINTQSQMNPVAIQRDYFGSDFSTAVSDTTNVPFPSRSSGSSSNGTSRLSDSTFVNNHSNITAYSNSPIAKRIARHVSLTGAAAISVESINLIPASLPSKNNTPPIAIPERPSYRHLRYTSELHQSRSQVSAVASRSDMTMEEPLRPRIDSEGASLYTNTLGSHTTEDVSSYSILRSPRRETSQLVAVAPSKHKLIVVEDGKPNVTYQMGNCIGRGQFGSVYRALNLNTGQMVAVKRIKIQGLLENEVRQLMGEVDLLKSLSHPSVVKYEGLVRGPEVVSIILEFVENGSLLHTLKAFGNFPEKLVASYVVKILEGLNYLHEMKVVHCDLKAANILTTKNGNVKLSDFGVSLNLQAVQNIKNDAIGTPNWMAPEVIELKGVSTAADIWSLGCTVIELLTGKPPYGDMLAMSALWRIVEDDCPPFPDKISEPLHDFLTLCFQKDPALRPSAEQLFEHIWLQRTWHAHLALRPQDSVPFFRRVSGVDARANQISILSRNMASLSPDSMQSSSSSSSPPISLSVRPRFISLRATSAPDGWTVQENALEEVGLGGTNSDQGSPLTPSAFPITSLPPPMSLVDLALRRGSDPSVSFDMLRSQSNLGVEKDSKVHGLVASGLDPSYLDLSAAAVVADASSLEDQNKPHSFVKITFAKAAICRICRETVKKHAVLCEECGLICHANCTKKAMTPCNLRTQLLMYTAHNASRASMDHIAASSPISSSSRGGALVNGQETPPTSPRLFKIPFIRTRKSSSVATFTASVEVPDTPSNIGDVILPTTPTLSIPASPTFACPDTPIRRRRFSLRPYLSRKLSPIQVTDTSMARSLSSPRSMSNHGGRTDSIGYGSSISSLSSGLLPGRATSITKVDILNSNSASPIAAITSKKNLKAQHRHSVNITVPVSTSSPLLSMESAKEAERKAKRRQSALAHGSSNLSTVVKSSLSQPSSRVEGVHNGKSTSNLTSIASPSKQSRLSSSRHDCIVI